MKNQKGGPFDPSALERAVVALRELNSSPHAHKALEAMIKTEETNKAKYEAQAKAREVDRVKQEGHERRENMDRQKQITLEVAKSNDQMERARLKDRLRDQEQSQEKIRLSQEESIRRQEELRRETIAFQLKKQTEMEEKKIKLSAQMQAESYRKNFDLVLRENDQKAEHMRTVVNDVFQAYLRQMRDGVQYFFTDPNAIRTIGKLTLFISGAYFMSKYGLGMTFRQIEAKINQPKLVRETSRHNWRTLHKLPFFVLQNAIRSTQQKKESIFNQMVLNQELQSQLETISLGMLNKRSTVAPLRNFLFYGPPGTGKTMFARLLAHNSGLHYAIISGGDIEKLSSNASYEIDKLFLWARSTSRGTILFVDEAESVFYKRSQHQTQLSNALSTLLAQTSSSSRNISLILASNLPQNLDPAALDRMDSVVSFEYQHTEQRKEMLRRGLNRICQPTSLLQRLRNPFLRPITITHSLTDEDIDKITEKLEGISARQIEKFLNSIFDETFLQQSRHKTIDQSLVMKVLGHTQKEKHLRQEWEK